mgnify:CR=1 FL=1
MGKLSADQASQLKAQVMNGGTPVATEGRDDGNMFSKAMGWGPVKHSLANLRRAEQLLGLGLGTAAGAIGEMVPGIRNWTPDVYSSTPGAFKAFWDQARQGDLDAAIKGYQDEMGAGKYFWGTSELIGSALAPAGLAKVGTKLISSAPKLAGTIGKVLPATRGGVKARAGVQEGIETVGKGLRLPWQAEEAVGRAVTYPLRKGWQKFRGAPAVKAAGEAGERVGDLTPEQMAEADALLGPAPTPVTPVTDADAVQMRLFNGEDIADAERILGAPQRTDAGAQQMRLFNGEDIAGAGAGKEQKVLDAFEELTTAKVTGSPADLGLWTRGVNAISRVSEDLFKKVGRTKELDGVIKKAQQVRRKILSTAESEANIVAMLIRTQAPKHFTTDAAGNILDPALQGKVTFSHGIDTGRKTLDDAAEVMETQVRLESPTVSDIAARIDDYQQYLTPNQEEFLNTLRKVLETGQEEIIEGTSIIKPGYNKVLRDNVPEWDLNRIRPDIKGNGFYIPRGRARLDGTEVFNTADEFIDKGRGGRLASEQTARMPAMGKMVGIDGNPIPELKNYTYDSLETTVQGYINQVADRVTDIKIRGKDGILTGLADKYKGTTPIARYRSGEAILKDVTKADDAFGRAIQREYLSNPWYNKAGIKAVNNWYRGVKANFDLSAIGIHGSLAMFRAPKEWLEATRLSFKALNSELPFPGKTRGGSQGIVDEARIKIDQEAKAGGRLTSRFWATFGLRQGGEAVETGLPGAEGLIERGGRIGRGVGGAFQVSNRLFGAFGDVLRLRWADELLKSELAKGRTIKELMESVNKKTGLSELQEIANAANRMTGWSDQRFGGDIGEFAMFASRFFQSRLETLGQAFRGATRIRLPTGEAMQTLGQTRVQSPIRVTLGEEGRWPLGWSGKRMIESDVLTNIGREMTIEQREALQTMIRLIGLGAFATELANRGNTDRRPFVDGRVNPNFYTIRVGGRDFSVFGPTIGLFRAIGTVARDPSPQGVKDASRGLGGGVVRLVWDNLTGYGFRGDPAPIGIFRDEPDIISKEEQRGRVSSPGEILEYLSTLALPISITAVIEEAIAGGESAVEGDWGRVVGAGLAVGAEAVGGRVSPLSRQDESEVLSQEKYGVPYESLTYQVQNEIDRLVTEKIGEYDYRGPKGSLYKKRDEHDATLVSASESLANEYLSASPASGDYSPTLAREQMNAAKSTHRKDIHGYTWSEAKQRMTGGLLESMYDRDQEKEDPKPGSREYRLWEYGQTFVKATDPKTGELDFDTLNKLQSRFWASLGYRQDPELGRVSEVDEMLESIRLIEAEFDPKMQNLLDAGRYASSFTMSLANENIRYYDLDQHKAVLSYITSVTGANPRMVEQYIDMTYSERDAFEKTSQGDRIGTAFARAQKPNGILWKLRRHFVRNAPREWKQAMFEAGYQYMGKKEIEAKVFAMVKAGETLPKHNYKNMHRAMLIGQ